MVKGRIVAQIIVPPKITVGEIVLPKITAEEIAEEIEGISIQLNDEEPIKIMYKKDSLYRRIINYIKRRLGNV